MALNKLKTTDVDTSKAEAEAKAKAAAAAKAEAEAAEAAQTPNVGEEEEQEHEVLDPEPAQEEEQEEEEQEEQEALEHEPEPEPETAQVKEAEPEPSADDRAVMVKQTNTQVAEARQSASQNFTNDQAAAGFEGLVLTGMSFDRVKLDEKTFLLGSDEVDIGDRIEFLLLGTREVYIIRNFDGKGAEMFYSYDKQGRFNTDGTSAQAVLDKWAEDGYGGDIESGNEPLSIKTYIEGTAQLKNRTDEYDETVVMLSIPPASRAKLGGAVAVGQAKNRAHAAKLGRMLTAGDFLFEAKVGKKVGSGEEAFYPWVFNAIGLLED